MSGSSGGGDDDQAAAETACADATDGCGTLRGALCGACDVADVPAAPPPPPSTALASAPLPASALPTVANAECETGAYVND